MALVFPTFPGLSFPIQRDLGNFSTAVSESVTGKKTFFANVVQPRYTYTIDIEGLDSSGANAGLAVRSMQTLVGFYNQCYGRALSFQFTDPDDSVATMQVFGTGDGTTTQFQLARAMGGFVEAVYAPGGVPQIYVAGTALAFNSGYSINMQTGVVTFATAPALGAALAWTGIYAWWCNWDDDKQTVSAIMSGIYEAKKLAFTTRIF